MRPIPQATSSNPDGLRLMLFCGETPSTGGGVLQWVLLGAGVIGLIGSLMQMGKSR